MMILKCEKQEVSGNSSIFISNISRDSILPKSLNDIFLMATTNITLVVVLYCFKTKVLNVLGIP